MWDENLLEVFFNFLLLDNTTIFFSNVYQDTISCYTLITNKSAKVEYLVAISLPLADHTPQCCCNVLRMCENNFFLKYYNLKMPSFSFYNLKMINLQCCQLNYISTIDIKSYKLYVKPIYLITELHYPIYSIQSSKKLCYQMLCWWSMLQLHG